MDGILLVDKPEGLTSHDVVHRVRKWLKIKAVGHSGTLDPLATGLLVLLVGKATKISQYILSNDKAYTVKVKLGAFTDTDDSTGEVTESLPLPSSPDWPERVRKEVLALQGELEIPIPRYSAKKMKGKKLYELARQDVDFKPPLKLMDFKKIELVSQGKGWVEVSMEVSKGSFVRSWARTLGEKLGVGGHVSELRRTHSMPYSVEESHRLDSLLELPSEGLEHLSGWVPLSQTLESWPMICLEGREEKLVRNGQLPKRLERFLEVEYGGMDRPLPGIKLVSRQSGGLLSLVRHSPPYEFKISRVFQ